MFYVDVKLIYKLVCMYTEILKQKMNYINLVLRVKNNFKLRNITIC